MILVCFNPHPANRPGDAGNTEQRQGRTVQVSIRTRLTGRVMRVKGHRLVGQWAVSIRTRLTGRVMLIVFS